MGLVSGQSARPSCLSLSFADSNVAHRRRLMRQTIINNTSDAAVQTLYKSAKLISHSDKQRQVKMICMKLAATCEKLMPEKLASVSVSYNVSVLFVG